MISYPFPGEPIILKIVILMLDKNEERKYINTPQRYYL